MLVLFDIDGTLLQSQRAGSRAMQEAARALFGDSFDLEGIEIAGRLDPVIWADAARANGIETPEVHHERFRAAYAERLARRLDGESTASLLPGVRDLIDALIERAIGLGVLTGNYPETGRLKLRAAGLDPSIFRAEAWGSDGRSRRDLPAVAMAMHERVTGRAVTVDRVLIIGDTPHDIDCARANGCRSIAVATGTFTRDELLPHGADLVVDDLRDTAALLERIDAMLGGGVATGRREGGPS